MPFVLSAAEAAELELCRRSFRRFARHWRFRNRETGAVLTFAEMWPGQLALAQNMERHPWLFALKAGKLGFTELECAFDAWAAIFRHPGARVHLFSKDQQAAKGMVEYVRYGLRNLPRYFGVHILNSLESKEEIIFRCHWFKEADDRRVIASYAATGTGAIDRTATHTHMDELSHVVGEAQRALWNSINTTVPPDGSIHIVTRGAGEVYTAELWRAAMAIPPDLQGKKPFLYPFFYGWDGRPDRTATEREQMIASGSYTVAGLAHFWPESWEDALAGERSDEFIPLSLWDSLKHDLPMLMPGDRTPAVLSLDAAVTRDCFAASLITRHPDRHDDPCVRAVKAWYPDEFPDKRISYDRIEHWLRLLLTGGCANGHPKCWAARHVVGECRECWPDGPKPDDQGRIGCEYCQKGEFAVERYNIVQVCYDPHQLEDMMQGFKREGLTWIKEFNQQGDRLVADSMLYGFAVQGRLSHPGGDILRKHVAGASAKVTSDDGKMRIVKSDADSKIDLVVCISMGVARCMELAI